MLKPGRLSVHQACPPERPLRVLKSICPLLRVMITYKKVQVLYHLDLKMSM